MRATGVGSMPGEDFRGVVRFVAETCPDLPFLPELPARGDGAGMTGRGAALLDGIGADLQPAGWRLTDNPGHDQRRARSLLAQDLDVLEEELQGYEGDLKVQVPGPWTLAATMERPRGDRVLADHGARRELAQSLASGIGAHVLEVGRRVAGASVVVQVDEPGVRAVLDGQIPTASGIGRHRRIHEPEADAALREVVREIRGAGGRPVVHSCASDIPVTLLSGAGFEAVSFDLRLVAPRSYDAFAAVFETGVDLWPGIPDTHLDPSALRRTADAFFAALGFGDADVIPRAVLTPTCGLAGSPPDQARRILKVLADAAHL
ncbi:methionine synthase [Mumia sp. ZJ1417]|uniref:methionine synthase n=1 Tax=Mumia sp. ZJ1417 TaxID=2708082 RepID=UPI00141E5C64|nr:methionine synthase [Mumia sp. ZJ1417]QMW65187.1 methionine synthase [Mumia sp. ZJ1417]